MTKETLIVGLLWHSITSDNLGVGALTLSQMALITKAAERKGKKVEFIVIGTRGGTPYPMEQFKVVATAEFALRAFKGLDFTAIKLMQECDLVFDIGEGDSFADIYGIKRLTMQVLAKMLVRVQGRKLVLSPQTIGPFKSSLGRRLGKLGMRAATRIYARDHLSSAYVRELGFVHKLDEVIDVAFALPFTAREKSQQRKQVGINVSGLMMQDGKQFGLAVDYPALMKLICNYFLSQPETDVYLVPHVISDAHEIEDDLRASKLLQQEFSELKVAPRFATPSEAKTFISGLDFFAGARMHACIAAFSSGVPVVPMAYSRKFNGLFASLGYDAVLDCLKLENQAALNFLISHWENRSSLQAKIQAGNAIAQTKLDKYVDDAVAMLPT